MLATWCAGPSAGLRKRRHGSQAFSRCEQVATASALLFPVSGVLAGPGDRQQTTQDGKPVPGNRSRSRGVTL
eukprot:8030724-Pyramimonas_sp.AAC.1